MASTGKQGLNMQLQGLVCNKVVLEKAKRTDYCRAPNTLAWGKSPTEGGGGGRSKLQRKLLSNVKIGK